MHEAMEEGTRVCLFGGSFDPPHICHVLAAVWATQTLDIDALWWVPVYEHAFSKVLQPWDHRVRMVQAAIEPLSSNMRVCTIESTFDGVSRTIDTVEALQDRHPGVEFSLLVGADLVDEIPRWKDGARLQKMVRIFALGREGYGEAEHRELALPDISSTRLRHALADGDRIRYQTRIPRAVLALIEQNGWYRS